MLKVLDQQLLMELYQKMSTLLDERILQGVNQLLDVEGYQNEVHYNLKQDSLNASLWYVPLLPSTRRYNG
ncbi:hypothetical protein JTB14_013572 [Gonioctena quinquepunctata]|nr:hypothetical protein JTB14_013572 [Gonioctena quinquepunctata]